MRKSAQTVSNVVTYLVEVSAPNPDLLLLPGMTANVRVIIEVREGVLKAPNAALRFRPPQSDQDKNAPAGHRPQGARGAPVAAGGKGRLYRLQDGKLVALPVQLGASDGQMTEISGPDVAEGTDVVIGTAESGEKRRPSSTGGGGPRMF